MRRLLFLLLLPVLAYLVMLAGVFLLQRRLIYHPVRAAEAELRAWADARGLQAWIAPDGRLIGWRQPRPAAEARLLVVHGNAGLALHRSGYVEALAAVDGGRRWEVAILEYPGYGARPGRPSEDAFRAAAGEALALLHAEDDRPVFVLGESIGSGVACALAAGPARVDGLMLIAPFTRLADVAARHFPWLPVRWLLRDRFDNVAALQGYGGPVAVLLAGRDEVIGPDSGRALHAGLPGPALLREQVEAGHNTLDLSPGAAWWREATAFLLEERP